MCRISAHFVAIWKRKLMKKTAIKLMAFILLLLGLSLTSMAGDFPDVPRDNSEMSKAIYVLHDAGIVGGYEDGTFRPNNHLTRAELCKIVNYVFGYSTPDTVGFSDVKTTDWFYGYSLVAKKAGYIKGFEDYTFRGNTYLTREQTCTIICRTAGLYDLPSFTVVKDKISDWAKADVMKVIANFVMPVDANGNFRATENITRGELAMALDSFVKGPVTPQEPVTPPTTPPAYVPPTSTIVPTAKYTVKFYNGNGSVMSTQTVESGKMAKAPSATPTKASDKEWEYVKFTGWDKSFSRVTSNLDIYPMFEKKAKEYKINLNYGNGTVGTKPASITVTYNELIAPKLPQSDFSNGSKFFAGWYAGNELIDTEKYSDLTTTTLTAKWVNTFTVKFFNGNGSVMSTQSVKYGEDAKAPTTTPTKAQDNEWIYTAFTGWDKSYTNVETNLDIHPVFEKKKRTYTVTLTYGDGVIGTKPESITLGYNDLVSSALPTNLTHEHKYFVGWYVGNELIDNEKYCDLSSTSIVAKWQDITYTVKFYNADGGVISTQEIVSGKSATAPKAPAKAEANEYTYTFKEWNKSYTNVRANLDIYPVYDSKVRTYVVNLNYGVGTTGTKPASVSLTYNELLVNKLPLTGFTNGDKFFAGWYAGNELIDTEKYSDLKTTTLTAKWVNTFTVKFYNGNGAVLSTQSVKYGESATPPTATPTKAQDNEWIYTTFTGWDKSYTNVEANLDIYPTFNKTARQYTVTLNYGGGSASVMPSTIQLTYNEAVLPKLPSTLYHAHKTFLGWYIGNEKIDTEKYSDLTSSTISAKWENIVYTVVFYNGDGSVMSTKEVISGTAATAPANATKAEDNEYTYTFTGWDKSFSNVTGNLNVYPVFSKTARKYTIGLNYGSGTTGTKPASITVTYNEAILPKLPTSGFANGDKFFAGWYAGNELIDTEKYSDVLASSLSAKWVDTFTVKFYNGDGNVLSSQSVRYGGSATPPSTTPTKAQDNEYVYTDFIGWDKSYTSVTSNLNIYPLFNKTERKYSVVLNYDSENVSGTKLPFITLTYSESISPKLPLDLTHEDKIFLGWYDGNKKIDTQRYRDLSSATLVAKWQYITYSVVFYDGDGSIMKTQVVNSGSAATAPTSTPKKAQDNEYTYEFTGWDKSFSKVKSHLEVKPVFDKEKRVYTVFLNYGSGTTGTKPASISVAYTETILSKLPKSGFTCGSKVFDGWYDGNKKITTERYCDLSSSTLTAGWLDTFEVKFYNGDGSVMKSEYVIEGNSATPPTTTPTKAMDDEWIYTSFAGWDRGYSSVKSNLNVYPTFNKSARTYTISLNYGSGTTGTMPSAISVTYNEQIGAKLPTSGFANGSKFFAGWYLGGELIDTESYADLSSKTLSAKWVDTFTVTFYNGNGSVLSTQSVKYGESVTAPTTTPTKAQDDEWVYTSFTGWDKSYANVTGNLDIYPTFAKTERLYTVTLNYGTTSIGTNPKKISLAYNQEYADLLPTTGFTNGKKIFDNWYYGTTPISSQRYCDLKATSLTAKWIDTYTVTFFDGDGSVLYKEESVLYGGSVATPSAIPTKASTPAYSYTFSGWDKSSDYVTSNLSIYPKFTSTEKQYTISLDYGDGVTGTKPATVKVGYYTTLSSALPKSGFSKEQYVFFKGWALGSVIVGTERYCDLTPSSLSAVWLDNRTIISEFQTILDEYDEPLGVGFSRTEKSVLSPVISAITSALGDAKAGIEVTRQYLFDTPEYSAQITTARTRYNAMSESDREDFPQTIINNFSNDTVRYLADLFDINIDKYM